MTAALPARLATYRGYVDEALDRVLPASHVLPARLHEAMRYAVLGGGKRVRALLVYSAARATGAAPETMHAAACAVELIHAYSLVHDDLPAMDDDDLRRGQPTCHRAFDEATALLAGDALQTLAFNALAHDTQMPVDAVRRLEMVHLLALAAGSRGMAGGQAIDLGAVGRTLDLAELENMHIHKTGALIRASVKLGALGGPNASPELVSRLDHYGKCIGLAFQIRDDILDVEGDTEILGKRQGADEALGKPTYPSIIGLVGAKERASELHHQARESLEGLDEAAAELCWIADYVIDRGH